MSVSELIDRLKINYRNILFGDEVTSRTTNNTNTNINELNHYNRLSESSRATKSNDISNINNIIEIPIDRSNGKRIIIYTNLLAKKNSSVTEAVSDSDRNKLKDDKLNVNDESDKSINVFMFIKCLLYLRNYLDKTGYKCSLKEMEKITAVVAGKIWRHIDDKRFEGQMKLVGFGLSKVLKI